MRPFTLKSQWQESKHPRVHGGPHGGEFGHGGAASFGRSLAAKHGLRTAVKVIEGDDDGSIHAIGAGHSGGHIQLRAGFLSRVARHDPRKHEADTKRRKELAPSVEKEIAAIKDKLSTAKGKDKKALMRKLEEQNELLHELKHSSRTYAWETADTPESRINTVVAHEVGHALDNEKEIDFPAAVRAVGGVDRADAYRVSIYAASHPAEMFAELHALKHTDRWDEVPEKLQRAYELAIAGRKSLRFTLLKAMWDESKHRRGQPQNAGQFGRGGSGTPRLRKPRTAMPKPAAPHPDIRHNPTLDALFHAPTQHTPAAAPHADIRHNPLLDQLMGATPAAAKPSGLTGRHNPEIDRVFGTGEPEAKKPATPPALPKRAKPGKPKPPPLPSFQSRTGMSRVEARSHAREIAGKVAGNFSRKNPNFEDIGGEIEQRLAKHPEHIANEFRRKYGITEGDSLETMGRKFHEQHRGGWSKDPELAGRARATHGLARQMSQIARLRSGGRGGAGRLRRAMTMAHSIQHLMSMYAGPESKPARKSFSLAAVVTKSDDTDGRWITIGGEKGEDGKRHGGSPVFIKNGRITKGHPGLVGRKIDALNEPAEGGSHRSEMRQSRDYEVAKHRKAARKEGIDPKHLDQLAAEMKAHHDAFASERTELLKFARRHSEANNLGSLRDISSQRRGREDAASLRGFDEVAAETQSRYPHHFREETAAAGGNHGDQLYHMLTAGNLEPMSHGEAYSQALEHLRNEKATAAPDYPTDWDEPLPKSFSLAAVKTWQESQHPRVHGGPHGGEFAHGHTPIPHGFYLRATDDEGDDGRVYELHKPGGRKRIHIVEAHSHEEATHKAHEYASKISGPGGTTGWDALHEFHNAGQGKPRADNQSSFKIGGKVRQRDEIIKLQAAREDMPAVGTTVHKLVAPPKSQMGSGPVPRMGGKIVREHDGLVMVEVTSIDRVSSVKVGDKFPFAFDWTVHEAKSFSRTSSTSIFARPYRIGF